MRSHSPPECLHQGILKLSQLHQKDIQENHSFSYKSKGFSPNLFLPFVPGKSENTKTVINKANTAKRAIAIKNKEKFPPAKSSKSAAGMRTNKGEYMNNNQNPVLSISCSRLTLSEIKPIKDANDHNP